MSSANSYPRCALELFPSRRLRVYSLLLICGALAAPWLAGLPVFPALLVSLPVVVPGRSLWRWSRGEISHLAWQADGRWELVDRAGRPHAARLRPGIFVGAKLLVLHWRCEDCAENFRATLLQDNCNADDLRQLIVRLRLTPDHELFGGVSTVSAGGRRSSRSG